MSLSELDDTIDAMYVHLMNLFHLCKKQEEYQPASAGTPMRTPTPTPTRTPTPIPISMPSSTPMPTIIPTAKPTPQPAPPRIRRWKVQPSNLDRNKSGYYRRVFHHVKNMGSQQLFDHTRMSRQLFDLLHNLTCKHLLRDKQKILPEERLSITLLFLSNGLSMDKLAKRYKIGRTTVQKIIRETCEVLWQVLSSKFVCEPRTSQYTEIASEFGEIWNMPNCIGAIDAKHISIKRPNNSNNVFKNNKKFFSIILMAACDARYIFTHVSVDGCGSESGEEIFETSQLGQSIINSSIILPDLEPLPNMPEKFCPYYFVADAPFGAHTNIMYPYPGNDLTIVQKLFNNRLSLARQVIENAFGILAARWRILRTTTEFSPETTKKIVLACVALHNFIMHNDEENLYCPPGFADSKSTDSPSGKGNWRQELQGEPLTSVSKQNRKASAAVFELRDELAEYFCTEDAESFHYENIMELFD